MPDAPTLPASDERSQPPSCGASGLPFSLEGFLNDPLVQHYVSQHFLEPGILLLKFLETLGFSLSGVLAFGGIGGLAIVFAAKDLLANFFGGLMIYLDRPFAVGDWVRSPDREIEGIVEKIGWRLTVIRCFDSRPRYIPNSVFTHITLENPSRMVNREIWETIGIRYDDASKMGNIVRDVKTMLQSHPDIDTSKFLMVAFNTFAPSSLDFFLYCLTKTPKWVEFHTVKQKVLLKILDIIHACGAEVALPTSTVHVPGGFAITQQTQPVSQEPTEGPASVGRPGQ